MHQDSDETIKSAGQSVVIVEDEAIAAIAMRLELERLGYRVVAVASTGADAVRKIRDAGPDLIVLDIRLADDVSGVDVAMAVRGFSDAPIVFVTGYDQHLVPQIASIERSAMLQKPANARSVHEAASDLWAAPR